MSTDASALLRAIVQRPDDDGPRLVYADFLSERGDPRGELIMLQCQWNRLADAASPAARKLLARSNALLKKHLRTWYPIGFVSSWDVRRGFAEEISMDADEFVEHGAALLEREPVRRIGLNLGSSRKRVLAALEKVVATPQFARLRELDLSSAGDRQILGVASARLLARTPGRLEALVFQESQLGDEGISELALSRQLRGLRTLIAKKESLTAAGVNAIAQGGWRLRHLDLSSNKVGDKGAAALDGPALTGLETLELTYCGLRTAGAKALAGATSLRALRTLNLQGNRIGRAGLEALLASGLAQRLEDLSLYDCGLGEECAELLAAASLPAMKRLELSENGLSSKALRRIQQALPQLAAT